MKTAVFYDLENIGLASKNGEFERAISDLLQRIKSSELVGDIILQNAYIRKTHPAAAQIEPIVKGHKIELVTVESLSGTNRKKANMVDFKMGVDIIAAIAKKRSIETVVVASGDNDFGFLCQKIKEMGKKLIVVSRFSATGDIMLKLCDDWIDLNQQVVTPKFLSKAIETRIPPEEANTEFFCGFASFLYKMEQDKFVCRYMKNPGLALSQFVAVMQSRNITIPRYTELGFTNLSAFMDVLLCESNFEYKNNSVNYNDNKKPLSQERLIESAVHMPLGYTREKLFKYYDILDGIGNVEELQTYISFMRQNGLIKGDALCPKQTFSEAIRDNIRKTMKKAGIVIDEDALSEFCKKL